MSAFARRRPNDPAHPPTATRRNLDDPRPAEPLRAFVVNGRDWRAEWDGVGAAADGQVDVSQVRAAGEGDSVPTKEVPMNGLAIILFCIVPVELTAEDHVDVAESNKFYDFEGREVFHQVIYWDWDEDHERFQVVAWRMVKGGDESYIPRRDWSGGGYAATWVDGDCIRRVRADSFRETWLQYDPELSEREIYPKERRRELRKAEVTK
jgi:hypothetical protein